LAVVNSGLVSGAIGREIAASYPDRLMRKIKTARRNLTKFLFVVSPFEMIQEVTWV
jgi:hypothetical protein